MSDLKNANLITIDLFDICCICKTEKKHIIELYPTRKDGAYYLNKFDNFLKKNHNMGIKEYCERYLGIIWPKCPLSKEDVGFRITGRGLVLSNFKRGRINKENCPKFAAACERASIERRGENNPMYGVPAWNKGKDKRNPIIKRMSEKSKNRIISEETKKRQSESAKKRKIHGHTGIKHSFKTREKLRENTAKLWASGRFNRITSIHVKMRDFLNSIKLKEEFQEEYQVKYFSMDFAFVNSKIAIECQGTYFHIDPRIYPNGPIDAIQRRNFGRDKAKKKVCCNQEGWKIIEIWETEINDGSFKEQLLCKLKELNLLND